MTVRSRADPTLLVVDDAEDNRYTLSQRLLRDGYTNVLTAADGRQALALLRDRPVDLVLLDVMMPEMNGYEVLERLKAVPQLRHIPVIMVSAIDQLDAVIRCIELGAEDYLQKPFNPVLLRARIGAALERKLAHDQMAEWGKVLELRVAEQVAQLERLGLLKRFFSPQLAELILAGGAEDPLKTHRREITVVFVDLRGFTAFAATSEPEEVMGVLREYHAEMGKLVLEYEGTLERFTGDGMMIFFNDPVPVANPEERAVRMAEAMRARIRVLGAEWRRRGYDLDFSMGIAKGYATIGAIGFEGRQDYAAIGSVTNLAHRLCSEASPDQILISQRIHAAVTDLVTAKEVGPLQLKGFHRPVVAYEVIDLKRLGP